VTPLAELLADRIRRFGRLTFADYMRECLYHPIHGYYGKAEAKRFADYYTSVDVHPIFGRLLARQFAEMWEHLGRPEEFTLVEAGAGVGRLASHILEFSASKLSDFYRALKYVAVERSASRREQIAVHAKQHVETGHATVSAEIPLHISAGCLFSNELVDALPVHRVVLQGGRPKKFSSGLRTDDLRSTSRNFPLAPSLNISRRRESFFTRATRRKLDWRLATGSRKSAAASIADTFSRSTTVIAPRNSSTTITCAARSSRIRIIARRRIIMLRPVNKT